MGEKIFSMKNFYERWDGKEGNTLLSFPSHLQVGTYIFWIF